MSVVAFTGGIKSRSAPPRDNEHAPDCTWRSGGWTALGECNCMKPVDPRERRFDSPTREWIWVAAVWIFVGALIAAVIMTWPERAHALDHGFDKNSPIGQWMADLERPWCLPGVKHCFCCGIADAYPIRILEEATVNGEEPDGLAEIADGSAKEWPDGTKRAPIQTGLQFRFRGKDVVKLSAGNPTGTAWAFLWPTDDGKAIKTQWCIVPLPPSM